MAVAFNATDDQLMILVRLAILSAFGEDIVETDAERYVQLPPALTLWRGETFNFFVARAKSWCRDTDIQWTMGAYGESPHPRCKWRKDYDTYRELVETAGIDVLWEGDLMAWNGEY